ncbi:MAG: hypothetical protein IJ249_07480 [Paludibacteraceae bacterium]|nr:hypothetical protein [Paludibacteraceae bacterium]
MNSKINPALYKMYLRLHDTLGAEMVHRRRRASSTCIEVIFHDTLAKYLHGRLNTLKEAESCGYWVICRLQNKRGHKTYHGKNVYQLFLSPVHPKKRNEARYAAQQEAARLSESRLRHLAEASLAAEVSFVPVSAPANLFSPSKRRLVGCLLLKNCLSGRFFLHMSEKSCTFVAESCKDDGNTAFT